MAGQYIPAGRTSVVKKGDVVYQLQTEYARIPHPRVTTSIATQGQVLHKIEKPIDVEVTTIEDMHDVEDIIKSQHVEVSRIIKNMEIAPGAGLSLPPISEGPVRLDQSPAEPPVEPAPAAPDSTPAPEEAPIERVPIDLNPEKSAPLEQPPLPDSMDQFMVEHSTMEEQPQPEADEPNPYELGLTPMQSISYLDEVERVYMVTADGQLVGESDFSSSFKKMFKHLFKQLPEMLNVFAQLPGGQRREEGIYEIEPGRILLVSSGIDFYLILLKPGTVYKEIKAKLIAILPHL